MRNRVMAVAAAALLIATLALVPASSAQDEMMTHTCDSTTILLLYIAEYQYGYQPMIDVSTFDKGQYGPLFDAMMAESDEMMESTPMATEESMMTTMEPMEGMTTLAPAIIPDEDPACTELRAGVEQFLYEHFSTEMMSESQG